MGRIKNKYKNLDFVFRPTKERKCDAYSGYRWALQECYQKYKSKYQNSDGSAVVNPNIIEMLVCVYDFDIFTGHTIQKRIPINPKYVFDKLKELEEKELIKKVFSETEVKFHETRETEGSTYIRVEPRKIRTRYTLSRRGRNVVDDFLSMIERHGNRLAERPYTEDTWLSRSTKLGIEERESKLADPYSEDSTIYWGEEENIDKWYEQGGD